jgi:AraC-like DNA-binding protein
VHKQAAELKLKPGVFIEQEFDSFKVMNETALGWKSFCQYRLAKADFVGHYTVLQLPNMQVSWSQRDESLMVDGFAPKEFVSIVALVKSDGHHCANRQLLFPKEVIIIDETQMFNHVSNSHHELAIVSVEKRYLKEKFPALIDSIGKKYACDNSLFFNSVKKLLDTIINNRDILNNLQELELLQEELMDKIIENFSNKKAEVYKLTKGEEVGFLMRDYLYKNLDEKLSMSDLAENFDISWKTMQNSFKSIFSLTPKRFVQILRFNMVYRDLTNATEKSKTVTEIAKRWGFEHLGRFSKNYYDIFQEYPIETLSRKDKHPAPSDMECP